VDEVENMKLLEELHEYEPQCVYNSMKHGVLNNISPNKVLTIKRGSWNGGKE
jgi:hypothetical protein